MSTQGDQGSRNIAEIQQEEEADGNRHANPEQENRTSQNKDTVGATDNDEPLKLSGAAGSSSEDTTTAPAALGQTGTGGPHITDDEEDEGEDDEEDGEEDGEEDDDDDDDDFPRFEDAYESHLPIRHDFSNAQIYSMPVLPVVGSSAPCQVKSRPSLSRQNNSLGHLLRI
ncbi:hypothetical protein CPB84DRAFT_1964877, partial [Gymnopilus junonius]